MDNTKKEIQEIVKRFMESYEGGFETNEHGVYLYYSKNGHHGINLECFFEDLVEDVLSSLPNREVKATREFTEAEKERFCELIQEMNKQPLTIVNPESEVKESPLREEIPTDAEITHYWKRKNCFGQYLEGLEHGSVWMRDKLESLIEREVKKRSVEQVSEIEKLVDFLLFLNDKGLINNHDFEYGKEAKKYIKKIKQ